MVGFILSTLNKLQNSILKSQEFELSVVQMEQQKEQSLENAWFGDVDVLMKMHRQVLDKSRVKQAVNPWNEIAKSLLQERLVIFERA